MKNFKRNRNKRKYFMGKLREGIPIMSKNNPSNLWVWTGEVNLDAEGNPGPKLETIASTAFVGNFTTCHIAKASSVEYGWIRMATKEDLKRMRSWKEEYSRFFTDNIG